LLEFSFLISQSLKLELVFVQNLKKMLMFKIQEL